MVHALGKAWHVEVSFYGSLYNETYVCSDLIFVIIHIDVSKIFRVNVIFCT